MNYSRDKVEQIKKIEIPHWRNGGTNFTSQLLLLIQKADPANRHKIALAFPDEVQAFKEWDALGWRKEIEGEPEIGTVVIAGKSFGAVEKGMKGVVYEHYDRSAFDNDGGIGISVIFESGFFDGFSHEDRKITELEITDKIIEKVRGFAFTDVTNLFARYKEGLFDEAWKD